MTFLRQIFAALRLLVLMTVLLGFAYPAVITLAAQVAPWQASGSPVQLEGRVAGSALLGQATDGPEWFQPRPSASDHSGETSGGSNLSPVSADQQQARDERAQELQPANPDAVGPIPEDALTASASGLDPHISIAYARWQVPRVASARDLDPARLEALLQANTDRALLGFIGQDGVNVTRLNAALAQLPKA